jgi:hypothetical protein
MRLWSIHPKYLDAKGLVALWREALLAQAVLRGRTRGYRYHPQLARFREHSEPLQAINAYLWHVHAEARRRGYAFDASKVRRPKAVNRIAVNHGQIAHEAAHLAVKLQMRDRARWDSFRQVTQWELHPLMRQKTGDIEPWERSIKIPH